MGAKTKAEGGLNKVLFIRVDEQFLDKIDALVAVRCKKYPNIRLSRSDVIRMVLAEEIEREDIE